MPLFLAYPFPFPRGSNSVCQQSQEHPNEEEGKSLPGVCANSWRCHPGGDEGWMSDRAVSRVHHEARREESRAYCLMLLSWVTGEVAKWSQDTQGSDPNGQYSRAGAAVGGKWGWLKRGRGGGIFSLYTVLKWTLQWSSAALLEHLGSL